MSEWATEELPSEDGLKLVVRLGGAGPLVVIVHGGANTARDYFALAERLVPRFRVALLERRNYGISGASPPPHRFEQDVGDVATLFRAYGPGGLFGHSAGGLVALHAARAFPDLVLRLSLYEPPLSAAGPSLRPVLMAQRELAAASRLEDALVLGYVRILGLEPDAARARIGLKSAPVEALLEQALHDIEAWTAMEPTALPWAGLSAPLQLIRGADSGHHPLRDSIDLLAEANPGAEVVELPGQGHVAHVLAPDMLAAPLLRFFDE